MNICSNSKCGSFGVKLVCSFTGWLQSLALLVRLPTRAPAFETEVGVAQVLSTSHWTLCTPHSSLWLPSATFERERKVRRSPNCVCRSATAGVTGGCIWRSCLMLYFVNALPQYSGTFPLSRTPNFLIQCCSAFYGKYPTFTGEEICNVHPF